MNGIVDERTSACSSCHMAAQWPTVAPMTAPADWARARCWFRNLDARYPFGFVDGRCSDTAALHKTKSLDFSLQLGLALRNWSFERTKNAELARTSVGVLRRRGQTLKVNGLATVPLRR